MNSVTFRLVQGNRAKKREAFKRLRYATDRAAGPGAWSCSSISTINCSRLIDKAAHNRSMTADIGIYDESFSILTNVAVETPESSANFCILNPLRLRQYCNWVLKFVTSLTYKPSVLTLSNFLIRYVLLFSFSNDNMSITYD
jgi:hypothetical protein